MKVRWHSWVFLLQAVTQGSPSWMENEEHGRLGMVYIHIYLSIAYISHYIHLFIYLYKILLFSANHMYMIFIELKAKFLNSETQESL